MSPYLLLLIFKFFSALLAMLPYGLDSNVTQLLANLLTKPTVFYYLPIESCNFVSIKLLLLLLKEVGSARLRERVIYTLSVRRPQSHNTNL